MAQSLFVSQQPKLPFSVCVNHRRGATAVKIPSAAASSFSSGIFERCNKILVDDLQKTKPFSIIQEHRTKPFTLILPRNRDSKPQVLGSGFILWKNYISLSDQVEIVNICQEFGVGPWGFYQPSFQNGVKLRLHMMCFGISWDPRYEYSISYKSKDSPTSVVPDYLISLVETSIQDSQAHLNSQLEIPIMLPDICIVSFYSTSGRRGFHQDLDETLNGIQKGWPVVSISIGDSAEFLYGRTRNMNKADMVLLESGDVLILLDGGQAHNVFFFLTQFQLAFTQELRLHACMTESLVSKLDFCFVMQNARWKEGTCGASSQFQLCYLFGQKLQHVVSWSLHEKFNLSTYLKPTFTSIKGNEDCFIWESNFDQRKTHIKGVL